MLQLEAYLTQGSAGAIDLTASTARGSSTPASTRSASASGTGITLLRGLTLLARGPASEADGVVVKMEPGLAAVEEDEEGEGEGGRPPRGRGKGAAEDEDEDEEDDDEEDEEQDDREGGDGHGDGDKEGAPRNSPTTPRNRRRRRRSMSSGGTSDESPGSASAATQASSPEPGPPRHPPNAGSSNTVAKAAKGKANQQRGPFPRWGNPVTYLRALVAGWLFGAAKWLGPQQMRLSD